MEIFAIILWSLPVVWALSACSLVYVPIKLVLLRRKKKDIWAFLTRRRLLLSALAYLVSAPVLGLFGILVGAAGVSGSGGGSGFSNACLAMACPIGLVFLVSALIAVALVFVRPTARSS